MIYLQFIRQAAFTSDVIAWFSQGHVSHVDAFTPDGMLLGSRSDTVGGKPPGVQIRPLDYANFVLKELVCISATDNQEKIFFNFLESQIGKPYDSSAIYGFATGRDWRKEDSWYCSELIAKGVEVAELVHPLFVSTNKITPVMLMCVTSAIGQRII